MSGLTNLNNEKGYGYSYYTTFGGINAQKGANDGEIKDMLNMTSDNYPVLSTRKKRKTNSTYNGNKGFVCYGDTIAYIATDNNSHDIFHFGEHTADLGASENFVLRKFVIMSNRILIFPDKKVYNVSSHTLESLESTMNNVEVTFTRYGELYGSQVEWNTIEADNVDFKDYFSVGDAITITGLNARTVIVREIVTQSRGLFVPPASSRSWLKFNENTFAGNVAWYKYKKEDSILWPGSYMCKRKTDYVSFDLTFPGSTLRADWSITCSIDNSPEVIVSNPTTGVSVSNVSVGQREGAVLLSFTAIEGESTETISLSRTVPDMDFVFSCNNRLWGCKGDSVYASKLGDPKNFNVFDGLSTDSWSVDVGTQGDFTGACEYLGYPMFFKEQGIFKVYGDYASQFSLNKNMFTGVKEGCGRTLAIAGDTLFYVGRDGVMAYTGGVPALISKPLNRKFNGGVAGSDGLKYYLFDTVITESQASPYYTISGEFLYIYDTYNKGWWKENGLAYCVSMGDRLYADMFIQDGQTITITLTALTDAEDLGTGWTLESPFYWYVEFADMTFNTPKNIENYKLEIMSDVQSGNVDIPSVNGWGSLTQGTKHSDVLKRIPQRDKIWRIRINCGGEESIRNAATTDIYSITIYTKEDMQ